ncbi:MAG TPA: hypothetical protein VFE40_15875 [Jatrophihabitantaceae bacterium]|jgi:hypothetical protein|nr:hypothetical protein [Jatrophihabitantaceae bacterium]
MSVSSAPLRPVHGAAGAVIAAISDQRDLPLVLVAAAQAAQRGGALLLVHATRSRSRGDDAELRDRALSLAMLCDVEASWATAVGRPHRALARACRDEHAALIVVGVSRSRILSGRVDRVLASARRLQRRTRTPVHLTVT